MKVSENPEALGGSNYWAEQEILYFHHRVTEDTEETILLVCPAKAGQTKNFPAPAGQFSTKAIGLMENRHLPILHKNILLRVLGAWFIVVKVFLVL